MKRSFKREGALEEVIAGKVDRKKRGLRSRGVYKKKFFHNTKVFIDKVLIYKNITIIPPRKIKIIVKVIHLVYSIPLKAATAKDMVIRIRSRVKGLRANNNENKLKIKNKLINMI